MQSGDANARPDRDQIKKFGDVGVAKPHTTMTRRRADEVFAVGPVEINVPILGVRIFLVRALKPKNAAENAILLATRFRDASRRLAAFEFGPKRCLCADFLSHKKVARGCLIAAYLKANPKLGGGCRPRLDRSSIC